MRAPLVALAVVLAAAASLPVNDGTPRAPAPPEPRVGEALSSNTPEPPNTLVSLGDQAPDFSYESPDGRWRRLRDLRSQAAVLLIFGADDADLRPIEAQREALLDLGTIPVVVLDRRAGSIWSTARALGLHYLLVPDPRRVIAEQFNAMSPITHRPVRSWFVVDQKGRVRGMDRDEFPRQGYARAVAGALGLPLADGTQPAQAR